MDVRKEWLSSYFNQDSNIIDDTFYSMEETVSEVLENFNIRRYQSAEGADVTVDGVNCRGLVQCFTNPLNQAKYDRELHVPININMYTGSIIDYDNKKWLVTSAVDNLKAYKSAGIVKTNNFLNLYKSGILYQIPCIFSSDVRLTNMGLADNQYLSQLKGERVAFIPNDGIGSLIEVGDKFKIGKWNYECIFPDDLIMPGLLVLDLRLILEEQEVPTTQPEYFINGSEEIKYNSVKTYEAVHYVNGVVDSTAQFNFSIIKDDSVPSDAFTLTTLNDSKVTIKCNKYSYYITLKAIDRNDNSKIVEKKIRLANLF